MSSTVVDVVPVPGADAGSDTALCAGASTTLDGSASLDPGCAQGVRYRSVKYGPKRWMTLPSGPMWL